MAQFSIAGGRGVGKGRWGRRRANFGECGKGTAAVTAAGRRVLARVRYRGIGIQ